MIGNNNDIFQTTAHAKCILAGEHAVIRGCPAAVLPIPKFVILLKYHKSNQPIHAHCQCPFEEQFLLQFWAALKNGLEILKQKFHKQIHLYDLHGQFFIENNIPIGAGIGFSSALCVVITRWLIWEQWLNKNKLFPFSRHVENIFHGTSSGVDIAGAMSDHIIHFDRSGETHNIEINWKPKLYLTYSGHIKNTEEAVKHVTTFRKSHPKLADKIDQEMAKSVLMIEEALKLNLKNGLKILAAAIQHANHCFEVWNLITPELKNHIETIYNLGAIAVKPTGAGEGGYVISLWQKNPPENSSIEFIPLF